MEEMASLVNARISEAMEAATCIDFEDKEMAEERLRLPTRMKGEGIKKQMDLRRPAVLGALRDILPRCMSITESNGEAQMGYILRQAIDIGNWGIGLQHDGHRNRKILDSSRLGPDPTTCKHAWEHLRLNAAYNYGLTILSTPKEW